jgi:hypothetical protein
MVTYKTIFALIVFALQIYTPLIPVINYAYLIFTRNEPVNILFLIFSFIFLVWLILATAYHQRKLTEKKAITRRIQNLRNVLKDKVTIVILLADVALWFWSMYLLYVYQERNFEMGGIAVINLVNFVAMLAQIYFNWEFYKKVT